MIILSWIESKSLEGLIKRLIKYHDFYSFFLIINNRSHKENKYCSILFSINASNIVLSVIQFDSITNQLDLMILRIGNSEKDSFIKDDEQTEGRK